MAGLSPDQNTAAAYGEGIYTPDWTQRTYAEMLARAEKLLVLGESVILDASWTDVDHRQQAAETARQAAAGLVALRCETPTETSRERLRTRGPGVSDADEEIAEAIAAREQPWPEATPIDTHGPLRRSVDQALAAVRPHIAAAVLV